MAFNTDTNGLVSRVAGHYALVLTCEGVAQLRVLAFATLADAAREIARRRRAWWSATPDWVAASVYSPRGKALNFEQVAAYGARLREEEWADSRYPGYVRRGGAVHGVHCYRGGGHHYFRRIGTTGERRLAQCLAPEDGEVAPRAARNARNIPNSWDDYARTRERSWKSQHRGRKAWDRDVSLPKGAA